LCDAELGLFRSGPLGELAKAARASLARHDKRAIFASAKAFHNAGAPGASAAAALVLADIALGASNGLVSETMGATR
jgi:hypothetical protein